MKKKNLISWLKYIFQNKMIVKSYIAEQDYSALNNYNVLVIADYAKGVLTPDLIKQLIKIC